jgi:hypothetical protein
MGLMRRVPSAPSSKHKVCSALSSVLPEADNYCFQNVISVSLNARPIGHMYWPIYSAVSASSGTGQSCNRTRPPRH